MPTSSESQRARASLANPNHELDAAKESMQSMAAIPELSPFAGLLSDFKEDLFAAATLAEGGEHDQATTKIRITSTQIGITFNKFEGLQNPGEAPGAIHQRLAALHAWQSSFHRIIRAIHLVIGNNLSKGGDTD